jgi:hypothetical protein
MGYYLPVIDVDEENVVTLCAKDSRYRNARKGQTMMFGEGDIVLRIYNKVAEIVEKSGKTWFYALWGGVCEDVWRIEWQTRKDILRRFGIRSFTKTRRDLEISFFITSQFNKTTSQPARP